jgi:predicted RNase H-like HicB family nuclease
METIKIIIEKSTDYYDAYAENCEGIYGAGETPEAAKKEVLKGLELFVNSRSKEELPAILQGEYSIVFQYDTQSLLNYYNKIFTKVALEQITGINQKLLHHYSSGLKKPRDKQREKIKTALHSLGEELMAVEL